MGLIVDVLGSIYAPLGTLEGVPLGVFVLVVIFTSVFLIGYLIKGFQIWRQLSKAIKGVTALKKNKVSPKPDDLMKNFPSEPMHHLCTEYIGTLHEVRKASSGGMVLSEFRSTSQAETMFPRDVLVDSRLFDNFTRHLPGILTGLGIIGTFAGLLSGLTKFDPTTPATAVAGLGPLMLGVQHAFLASGFAIACAMGIVFISRLTLAYFYRLVERLCHTIDSLYSSGAGEEYLARLVRASELNEAHSAQLKDALVEDLTKLMTNLTERQISAHEANSLSLGDRIGESVFTAMEEPMKRIGDAMENTTKGNGEQVGSMLENLLTGFMAKLEDTFGGQIKGINEQMQRSMDSMTAVQESLQGLLADIGKTNEQATNQMSGKLEDAMKLASENQSVLTNQMREFVQEFRNLVTEEQSKSKQVMDEAVMKVLGQVAASMEQLESVRKAASTEEQGRNEQLKTQTTQLVGDLTGQMDSLLHSVSDQVLKTQSNIDAFGKVSLKAIDGMNQGALTMGSAAQRFETAGNSVSGVFERSVRLAEQLTSSSATLQALTNVVQKGFEQYDSTRRTVDAQVASLTGLLESARKEAGISKELVSNIKASADAMSKAEAESRQHLGQVNEALNKAFSDFGNALVNQIKKTIAETDGHLAKGTGHLSGVVQELATAVQRMRKP